MVKGSLLRELSKTWPLVKAPYNYYHINIIKVSFFSFKTYCIMHSQWITKSCTFLTIIWFSLGWIIKSIHPIKLTKNNTLTSVIISSLGFFFEKTVKKHRTRATMNTHLHPDPSPNAIFENLWPLARVQACAVSLRSSCKTNPCFF